MREIKHGLQSVLPGSNNELLALGTGIRIEIVSHDDKGNLSRNVAVLFVLLSSSTQAQDEENVPRHAHLEEHLEVENAEHARVELSSHEEIVDWVSGHAVLLASVQSRKVGHNGNEETADDSDGQQGAELVNGIVHGPDASKVQDGQDSKTEVQAHIAVAVVWQLLTSLERKRLAIGPNTREKAVAGTLEDEIAPVPDPCLGMRESTSVDQVHEVSTKV